MTKIYLKDWIDYLESRVGIDVYVWGGNGQPITMLLPVLCEMENKNVKNIDRDLKLISSRLMHEITIDRIRGCDCSGLGVKYLLDEGVISGDMTANGLYNYIVGTDKIKPHGKKIKLSEVQAGDYLFEGTESNKNHIGYAVDNAFAVESQNRDVGVVKTRIADRKWKFAARPDWYEVEKYTLTRVLMLTDPHMKGEDIMEVQKRLNELGYNCGTADGVFGNKTEIASKNFKHDAGLKNETGTIGEKTAKALGFNWAG